jgi:hypothetical protein
MQSDNDAFIVVCKIGAFCFYRQILLLILIQRQFVDDFSDDIEAALYEVLIDFQFVISFSEYLIPFFSAEVIFGVEIALHSVVAHEVTTFTGKIVISLVAAYLGGVSGYPKVLNLVLILNHYISVRRLVGASIVIRLSNISNRLVFLIGPGKGLLLKLSVRS